MHSHTLIWADLRVITLDKELSRVVGSAYPLKYVREPSLIPQLVSTHCPTGICFEYDKPGARELEPLRRTRLEFPSLPVLLITVEHSEELAVWALRMKVADYVVVPVELPDLFFRIAALVSWRSTILQQCAPMEEGVPDLEAHSAKRLLPALSYVEANYSEKVALGVVARLCGLGRYQFSRAFKQAHGTTFREFLIVHRIGKAMQMLKNHGASITEVAFSVGFNDLSHFAQMFRRYVGVCPSIYVHWLQNERGQGLHPPHGSSSG